LACRKQAQGNFILIKLEAALPGRWHEQSAGSLKLPAGNNSAYLARNGCYR
jgi:hypothetical protein